MPLTVAERILYSTTNLTAYHGGAVIGTGTGFFYTLPLGPDSIYYLMLTNKHVLTGATEIAVKFHIAADDPDGAPSGRVRTWKIDVRTFNAKDNLRIIDHPRDDVDLCAINMTPDFIEAAEKGYRFFATPMSRAFIPGPEDWQSFDALEEVTMIGCPRGIYDEANNIPVMRRGITSTPILKDFNGKPEFLVDMACFPGSSGSPIFLFNREGYFDKAKKTFLSGKHRFHLVGILYAGPLIRADGHVTISDGLRVEVSTPMHLGFAIRSTQILGIEAEIHRRRAAKGYPRPTDNAGG
ncbi:MAG: serine protease [Pseudomonadales bacterium]